MCRIPSGMLMSLEEGGSSAGDGFFGRVTETINAARDITHILLLISFLLKFTLSSATLWKQRLYHQPECSLYTHFLRSLQP
jgi:hypothetical protein